MIWKISISRDERERENQDIVISIASIAKTKDFNYEIIQND